MAEISLQEGWANVTAAIGRFNKTQPNPQLFRVIRHDQPSEYTDSQAVAQTVAMEADILYKLVWRQKVPIPKDFMPSMVREAYGHPAAAVFVVQALEQGRELRDFHGETFISGTRISMPGIDMLLEIIRGDESELRKHFATDRSGGGLAHFVGYDPEMDYVRRGYSDADYIEAHIDGINALAKLGAERFNLHLQIVPVKISEAPPRFSRTVDSREQHQQRYRDTMDRVLRGDF